MKGTQSISVNICNCFDSANQGCNPEPCPIHLPDDVPLSAEEIEAEE